jgi:hypothetical protein
MHFSAVLAHVLKDEGFEVVVECATAEAAELIVASAGTDLNLAAC